MVNTRELISMVTYYIIVIYPIDSAQNTKYICIKISLIYLLIYSYFIYLYKIGLQQKRHLYKQSSITV